MLTTIRELLSSSDFGKSLRRLPTAELMEISYNAHAQHDSLGRMVEIVDAELASRETTRTKGGVQDAFHG